MIASCDHTLILMNDGRVLGCGRNDCYQLGLNDTTHKSTLQEITALSNKNIVSIAVGPTFSLALSSAQQVYIFGQIQGKTYRMPQEILNKCSMIAAGDKHALFLNASGQVFSMGASEAGALGIIDKKVAPVPRLIDIAGKKQVLTIAAGHDSSLFLTAEGPLYACGSNAGGQLGFETSIHSSNTPRLMSAFEEYKVIKMTAGLTKNVVYLWLLKKA
jgi:alpha-tubulin suppressor-like RCC1 family protein